MLLQVALDKPEHLALLPGLMGRADIIEVGTPLLKRFGLGCISTVLELCPDVPVLADTKTVDGGLFEAEMVFGAGASFMTVLSTASSATHRAVASCAERFGASVIADTITESGKAALLPDDFEAPAAIAYIAVHSPTDARLEGDASKAHIEAVAAMKARGYRVSLAGGIGRETVDEVVLAAPEIVVVGSAITEADNPEETAEWIRNRLTEPGLGWPWDKR